MIIIFILKKFLIMLKFDFILCYCDVRFISIYERIYIKEKIKYFYIDFWCSDKWVRMCGKEYGI